MLPQQASMAYMPRPFISKEWEEKDLEIESTLQLLYCT